MGSLGVCRRRPLFRISLVVPFGKREWSSDWFDLFFIVYDIDSLGVRCLRDTLSYVSALSLPLRLCLFCWRRFGRERELCSMVVFVNFGYYVFPIVSLLFGVLVGLRSAPLVF